MSDQGDSRRRRARVGSGGSQDGSGSEVEDQPREASSPKESDIEPAAPDSKTTSENKPAAEKPLEKDSTTPPQKSDHDDDYASAAEDSIRGTSPTPSSGRSTPPRPRDRSPGQSGSEAGSGDEEDEDEVGDDDVIEGDDDVSSDAVRGAGDGQEEAKVDDDEDRRNPQYIPKRGNFYEHDDREDSEGEAGSKDGKEGSSKDGDEGKDGEPRKQRVWRSEAVEKWGHDKFMELEQEPKSKDELVSAYGYDIRNEDNAPRARRRRRYGRGPNKYTRKWEDMEAYGPQANQARQQGEREGTGKDLKDPKERRPKGDKDGRKKEGELEEDFPALSQPTSEGQGSDKGSSRGDRKDTAPKSDSRGSNRTRSNREAPLQRQTTKEDSHEDDRRHGPRSQQQRGDTRHRSDRDDRRDDRRQDRDDRRQDRGGQGAPRGGGPSRGGGRGGGRGGFVNNQRDGGHGDYQKGPRSSRGPPPAPFPDRGRRDHDKLDAMMGAMDIKGGRGDRDRYRDNVDDRRDQKPKRYSTQRDNRRPEGPRANGMDNRGNKSYNDGGRGRNQQQHDDFRYNGQNTPTTAASGYVFPSSGPSGPPAAAPFHPQHGQVDAAAQLAAQVAAQAPNAFMPAQLAAAQAAGYHAPVTVAAAPLMVPGQHAVDVNALAMAAAQEQLMHAQVSAAAAAGAPGGGYAEVRGGVTYFNAPPPAQVSQMPRGPALNKRPKAAIPIVDPKQMQSNVPLLDQSEMNGNH